MNNNAKLTAPSAIKIYPLNSWKAREAAKAFEQLPKALIPSTGKKGFVTIHVKIEKESLWFMMYYPLKNAVKFLIDRAEQDFEGTLDLAIVVAYSGRAYLKCSRTGEILVGAAKKGVVPNLAALILDTKES